jgi:hypothetical protein
MEFHPAVIQGGKIVLEADLGLPDGQKVEVVVLPVPREPVPGEGILRTAGSMADDPNFDEHMAIIERDRRPESEAPLPRTVRVVGTLDMISLSTGGFELILDDGSTADGVLVEGDIAAKAPLAGSRVLVQGKTINRPSGGLLRIEARTIDPAPDAPGFWSKIPPPLRRTMDPAALRKPQTSSSGVSAFFGTWPGDETDEEWNLIIEGSRP